MPKSTNDDLRYPSQADFVPVMVSIEQFDKG
jgi:hypothetical protein